MTYLQPLQPDVILFQVFFYFFFFSFKKALGDYFVCIENLENWNCLNADVESNQSFKTGVDPFSRNNVFIPKLGSRLTPPDSQK